MSIRADRGGDLDGFPTTLGVSDRNGEAARAIGVGALERAYVHFLGRRKFVVPGNSTPIRGSEARLSFRVPVQPFTQQAVLRGMYSTIVAPPSWVTVDIYQNNTLLDSISMGASLGNNVLDAIAFNIPFAVGTGVAADMREINIEATFTAQTQITIWSSQLAMVPVEAIA